MSAFGLEIKNNIVKIIFIPCATKNLRSVALLLQLEMNHKKTDKKV